MKNNKIMMLFLVVLLILLSSSISFADNSGDDSNYTTNSDNSIDKTINNNVYTKKIVKTDNSNLKQDTYNADNYDEFQQSFNTSNATIILKNKTYDINSINLSRTNNIVVEGNGANFTNLNNNTVIWYLNGKGNLTFKNINFVNFRLSYIASNSLTNISINNCNFINITSYADRFFQARGNLYVNNSSFVNVKSSYVNAYLFGLSHNASGVIQNSKFMNFPPSLVNNVNSSVKFINNTIHDTSLNTIGLLINKNATLEFRNNLVKNITFTPSNQKNYNAILLNENSNATLINNSFISYKILNLTKNTRGITSYEKSKLSIINNTFSDGYMNGSKFDGFIFARENLLNITGNRFISNTIESENISTGLIYAISNLSCTNNNFSQNRLISDFVTSGTIYALNSNSTINGNLFDNNVTGTKIIETGDIYLYNASASIHNNTFKSALTSDDRIISGSISVLNKSKVTWGGNDFSNVKIKSAKSIYSKIMYNNTILNKPSPDNKYPSSTVNVSSYDELNLELGENWLEKDLTINLKKGYYNITDYISTNANRKVILNGHNSLIDGLNRNSFLNDYSKSLTINNLTIVNCYSTSIYSSSNLTLNNCTFNNTGSVKHGDNELIINNCTFANINDQESGAVSAYGTSCKVTNSVFKNNQATNGGAISFGLLYGFKFPKNETQNGSLIISNCTFINNMAKEHGGAVCSLKTKLILNNSTFDKNMAFTGGAVYSKSISHITNSTFKNNNATISGAISIIEETNISNCNFTKNMARQGGAIGSNETKNIKILIDNCNFNSNIADDSGAILTEHNSNTTINNCSFTNNQARRIGGAIGPRGNIIINKSTFSNNTAIEGSAIWITGYSQKVVINNRIIANHTNKGENERVIYATNNHTLIIDNSIFEKNAGKILHCYLDTNTTIMNSRIRNINTTYTKTVQGAIIDNYEATMNITNNTFTNITINAPRIAGGIMYQEIGSLTISGNKFSNINLNVADKDSRIAGSILWNRNTTSLVENNIIQVNTSSDNVQGGIFYNNIGNLTIRNNTYTGNITSRIKINGEIIYNDYDTSKEVNIKSNLYYAKDNNQSKLKVISPNNVNHTIYGFGNNYIYTHKTNLPIVALEAPSHIDTGESVTFNISVFNQDMKILNGTAIIKINGLTLKQNNKNIQAKIINGKGNITYTLAGYSGRIHNVTAVFAKTGYDRGETSVNMTVVRGTYQLSPFTINATSEQKIRIYKIIKDSHGNIISGNTKVAIKISGKTIATTTAVNGVLNVTAQLGYFPPGKLNMTIILGNNYRYNLKQINSTATISKQNVTVTIPPITAKKAQTITVKAILKNSNTKTNVISGKYNFKVNGVTVSKTTKQVFNATAQMTYTLPGTLKPGTYSIMLVYNGNTQSNSVRYSSNSLTITS